MRSVAHLFSIALLGVLLAPKASPRVKVGMEPRPAPVRITVSAAASLKDALTEIVKLFGRARPDVEVALNFGASGALELQIEQGAPVDAFISASNEEMDKLAAKNLLSGGSRVNLLKNTLVLIAPRDAKTVTSFQDLTRADVRVVAMGDPRTVPAGMYAQQVLTSVGIYDAVKNKIVLATDVRQVLAFVETGSAQAGLVYATDASASPNVAVVAEAPIGSHEPIVYPAALMRDSQHPDAARAFVDFLKGAAARSEFTKDGFRPADR